MKRRMKKSLLTVLAVLLTFPLLGRSLERTVMYTLAPGEILSTGEYIVQYRLEGSRFALLTYNPQTGNRTFVFNGKPIVSSPCLEDIYDLGYIDVNTPDGYVINVRESEDYYVNRGGKMEGPYEYVFWYYPDEISHDWFRRVYGLFEMTPTYHYVLADRVYVNKNGVRRKSQALCYLGAIRQDGRYYIANKGNLESYSSYGRFYSKGDTYAYVSFSNDSEHLYLNGSSLDWGADIEDVMLNERGDCVYCCRKQSGEKLYVMKNGEKIDTVGYDYENVQDLHLTSDGEVAYISRNRDLHLPGQPVRTFDRVSSLTYYDREHYGFCYQKDGNWFVRINGRSDLGPYAEMEGLVLHPDGRFMYCFMDTRDDQVKTYTIKTSDGNTYGPSPLYPYNPRITEDGYSFIRIDDGQYHLFDSADSAQEVSFSMGGSIDLEEAGHSFYSHYEYDYVVIDGERVGQSAALQARYDKAENAFVWLSLEGQELAVYEYRLD